MRHALLIVIAIHGIIHLFGFLKAFAWVEFTAISHPILKVQGLVWLLTFLLYTLAVLLLVLKSDDWWLIGLVATLLSQYLIICSWSDAKFGTVVNLIILASVLLTYSSQRFKKQVSGETARMFTHAMSQKKSILTQSMTDEVPWIIQQWLLNSGAIGKESVSNVYLEQDIQMLLKTEQREWIDAKATQFFTTDPPAFNWSVDLKMSRFLHVAGRDKFENGRGEMSIKLFSLFPMVNEKNEPKLDEATLQRFLAEIVWFPSFALSGCIRWEGLDNYSAKATMEYNGTKGSGVFHFDENGVFKRFVAMRYKDVRDAEPTEWRVSAVKTALRNGIQIPVESKVEWKLESGLWTWLKLKITKIDYDVEHK